MKEDILNEVKEFVKLEFEKPNARFKESFDSHFKIVVKYCLELAEKEDADKEIVEIAAWLHDIGNIRGHQEDHHIISAEIADELLSGLGYPRERIEAVNHCILTHRGSVVIESESKEAQILKDADAMSHFDDIDGITKRVFGGDKKKTLAKLERSYNKLSDAAKPLVFEKLKSARKILK
jgi:uncharacterized protein